MPHTRSAKRHLRKSEKQRVANRAVKSTLRTHLKRVDAAAQAGDVEKLKEEVRLATKKLDKAAAKRVIHPNKAARKKAQLGKLLHAKAQGGGQQPAAAPQA